MNMHTSTNTCTCAHMQVTHLRTSCTHACTHVVHGHTCQPKPRYIMHARRTCTQESAHARYAHMRVMYMRAHTHARCMHRDTHACVHTNTHMRLFSPCAWCKPEFEVPQHLGVRRPMCRPHTQRYLPSRYHRQVSSLCETSSSMPQICMRD